MENFKEVRKKDAVKRMRKLKIMENVIQEFMEEDKLYLSEFNGILYWLNEEQKEMVRSFEAEYNALVYHVIKSYTNIGIMYSLLYISSHKEEWEQDMMDLDENCAIAYVFNETDPMMSEIGYIAVQPQFGGVTRIL